MCCHKKIGLESLNKYLQHLLVRKDMDVNDHEKLFNITLRHQLK